MHLEDHTQIQIYSSSGLSYNDIQNLTPILWLIIFYMLNFDLERGFQLCYASGVVKVEAKLLRRGM